MTTHLLVDRRVEVRHLPDEHGKVELDEVVGSGVDVHLERMADDHVWIQIGDTHVDIYVAKGRGKRKLLMHAEER